VQYEPEQRVYSRTVTTNESAPVYEQPRPVQTYTTVEPVKTTVIENQPVTTTYVQQAPVTQYISSQPTVVRQQYTPSTAIVSSISGGQLYAPNLYRPKKIFRFAKPDYNWQGPINSNETHGHIQLVKQGYTTTAPVTTQYLSSNTVRTSQPSVIRTSQSSRVVAGPAPTNLTTTYTTGQPHVIRKSYNSTAIPTTSYTTTNQQLGARTVATGGQTAVIRYV
jgi:hypothetical protein